MIARVVRSAPLRVAALAILLTFGAEAGASAASGPVMQLRVDRKLHCSATLVASQYVLTAGHCVRSPATSRVRVVAGSGTLRIAKVATLVRAPRVNGRRPDLALVQLTSRSALKPAGLGGDYSLPVARKGVTARGWRATKSFKVAKGKLLRKAAPCGRTARRQHLLCARLRHPAASRRCADAAGAALLTKRHPVLVGIGTKGSRNCRRHARASFVPITASVRAWVAEQIAPATSPAPTPSATPAPVDPLAVYPGAWQGEVSQDQLGATRSYLTKITIDRTGPPGQPAGSSGYGGDSSSSGCGGTLQLLNNDNAELTTLEQLAYGQQFCIDGGTVRLTKVNGEDALAYSWTKGPDDGRATGVLRRTTG